MPPRLLFLDAPAIALVGDAVGLAILARPVGDVAFVEYAVLVAIAAPRAVVAIREVALIGNLIQVAVEAGPSGDVDVVGHVVLIAVHEAALDFVV